LSIDEKTALDHYLLTFFWCNRSWLLQYIC